MPAVDVQTLADSMKAIEGKVNTVANDVAHTKSQVQRIALLKFRRRIRDRKCTPVSSNSLLVYW